MASITIFAITRVDAGQGLAVGMVTQVSGIHGAVEVMAEGSTRWKPARPLLALRTGDTIRTTEDASAIVLLSSDPRSVKIDATNSPFVVPAPRPDKARSEKVVLLLRAIIDYLSASSQEKLAPILVTRQTWVAPSILSPRAGPVLPGPLSFDWSLDRAGPATVTVLDSSGHVLFKRAGVTARTLAYPEAAPQLVPSQRYILRVQGGRSDSPPLDTWFEVVAGERADEISREMADLERLVSPEAPVNSLVIIKAGYLAKQGLFHDARRLLLAALAEDAQKPALHLLLGHVYAETGLPDLASESYRAASLLLPENKRQPTSR